ncbi:MAG TPA: trigger factor [Burkholderiales bacterium]|nr:trigger factor [Burkholderiales bacterium]
MQANLETLSGLERRLNVAVPLTEIETEVQSRLKHIGRTAKMPGFRPGKVPFKVVQQQYGAQVRQEVLGATLEKSFGDAVRQQNLKVAGYPKFEPAQVAEGASDFQYSATFEVYPEIKVGDISAKSVDRVTLEVGEAEVDKTLDIMRKQRVTYEVTENTTARAAQTEDRVQISYKGTIDGAAFEGGAADKQYVVLGEGRLLADFEGNLAGMKAGESKAFDLKFPDDYRGKEVAGKTAHFEVTVSEVAVPRLPLVDAEFAKTLGVEDGDVVKMRAEVKANLEREVKQRLKAKTKDQVMQALLDATPLDAPKSLIEMEIQTLQNMARENMTARGMPVKDDMPMPPEIFEAQARRRVSLGLILGELVRTHSLHARPEQVRAAVDLQAQSYEHPQEVVKWFYQQPERLRDIESVVLEENVVEWALGVTKAQDKAITFDELMGYNK